MKNIHSFDIRNLTKVFLAGILTALFFSFSLLCLPNAASAQEPPTLSKNFEDLADAIDDDAEVAQAVEQVPGKSLHVVLVKDFGSMDADAWAISTAEKSGLRSYEGLIAIATEGREIGYAGGYAANESNQQIVSEDVILRSVDNSEVKSLLSEGDWSAAVTLISSHVATLVNGGSIESNAPSYPLLVLVIVVAGGIYMFRRSSKKKQERKEAENLKELSIRAASELVQVDDGVRSAMQELEFVKAEFGLQASQQFAEDLKNAQASMQEAFSLRTLLDDENPETPEEQRTMNTRILEIAQSTRTALAAQEQAFTELRNLSARAEEKVAEITTRTEEVRTKLPLAHAKLENLTLTYPASMLSSLISYPDQITILLEHVQKNIKDAQKEIDSGDKNGAVGYIKLAESTLSNAAYLLDRINRAPELIEQAKSELSERIQSLSSDVHDAKRLGAGNSSIEAAKIAAENVLANAQNPENKDLIALNEQLTQAEANLDKALFSVREEEQALLKLQKEADDAKTNAEAMIDKADSYINTYRSAVNADARTQLARARKQYNHALQMQLSEQVSHFTKALNTAQQALNTAEYSVSQHNNTDGNDSGSFLAGVVVSSILNGLSSSSSSSSSGGGFSSGGFSGGFSGGSSGGGFSGGRIGF